MNRRHFQLLLANLHASLPGFACSLVTFVMRSSQLCITISHSLYLSIIRSLPPEECVQLDDESTATSQRCTHHVSVSVGGREESHNRLRSINEFCVEGPCNVHPFSYILKLLDILFSGCKAH